jgi:hypothetical protein
VATKISVTLELTSVEVDILHKVYDEITKPETDMELYFGFEEIVRKISAGYDDEVVKVAKQEFITKRLADMKSWEDEACVVCKHLAGDHAMGGTGICIICGPCMEFKGKAKKVAKA